LRVRLNSWLRRVRVVGLLVKRSGLLVLLSFCRRRSFPRGVLVDGLWYGQGPRTGKVLELESILNVKQVKSTSRRWMDW